MDRTRRGRDGEVIAIVGGGFCGTMVAVHLVRRTAGVPRPPKIVLIEKRPSVGRGLAYGTTSEGHLLNVPAGGMSAFADRPSDFFDWLSARTPEATPATFAPRRRYGEYLGDLFEAARIEAGGRLIRVRAEATGIERIAGGAGLRLILDGGEGIKASRVVLATGHAPPDATAVEGTESAGDDLVRNDPWSRDPLEGVAPDDPLVLIGTGLTAVDVITDALDRGHRGRITAVSRHGLLPRPHAASPSAPRPAFAWRSERGDAPTALRLLRMVRREAELATNDGGDWRAVFDSLRPATQEIWKSLDMTERRRFLRHAASYWEIHRHRVAPSILDRLNDSASRGRLRILAGRVEQVDLDENGLSVAVRRRGSGDLATIPARRLIRCTGPSRDVPSRGEPLVRDLLRSGIGRPAPLRMSLDVTEEGHLIGRDGRPDVSLMAIGPLLRERLWESTAVRELRTQAEDVARRLAVDWTAGRNSA